MRRHAPRADFISRLLAGVHTPIDPKKRLSNADATRIFSLRGRAVDCLPPADGEAIMIPPSAFPIWLTLDEAVQFSGLSRRWLLRQAETEQELIAIRDLGKNADRGRYRFLRWSLAR